MDATAWSQSKIHNAVLLHQDGNSAQASAIGFNAAEVLMRISWNWSTPRPQGVTSFFKETNDSSQCLISCIDDSIEHFMDIDVFGNSNLKYHLYSR